jgi:UPF0755 protein
MGLRAAIALLMLLGAGLVVLVGREVLTPTAALESGTVVAEIPAHDGIFSIAGRLHQAGGIRSRTGFVLLATFRGTARHLKAGEYELERGASTLGVLSQLEAGRVKQHVILHPEGATLSELARALEGERLASGAAIQHLATDPAFLSTLGIEAPSLEGYLFPDTYQFVRGMTAEEILGRMVQRLRAKLGADITARAAARGLSVHQLLTLASIIEREAVERDEMRTISGVFWNRLKLKMPLQADPTVQYAIATPASVAKYGWWKRELTDDDLRIDSAYNTYIHSGLPPGPIANPGIAAIRAVIRAPKTNYIFFVAAPQCDGSHRFSTTLAEHQANVNAFRSARCGQ